MRDQANMVKQHRALVETTISPARYLDYTDINMICEVDETELERERPNAALYMCRCADGDLWTLAKKYGSDTEIIKQINEIDEVPSDRLLLIPVV